MPGLSGRRVLLVTDRPFLGPVDGSAHTYRMWLDVLTGLGCAVSVLSFSRFSQPWTPADIASLRSMTHGSLIVDAQPGRGRAAAAAALSAIWRIVAGRRYLPPALERAAAAHNRSKVAAFLEAGRFDAVVVNKLHTTALVGHDLLRAMPAAKLIDMHDDFPRRERLNRQVYVALLRRHGRLVRGTLHPRDMLGFLGWAGPGRLLREEATRLGDFDHVIFNAGQEADGYAAAGVQSARIHVLRLPHPAERGRPAGPGPRAFPIGLIGSASLSNIEAVEFLGRHVLPRLRRRGVRLLVAGAVGRFARAMLPSQEVEVLGWIDDVRAFYDQVEIAVVPLLTGTGVSVKTLEAASHGAAIVTTTVGARGMALRPGRDMIVADGAEAFACAIGTVLDDPALRASLRRNARDALRRDHSRASFAHSVAGLLGQAAA